MPAFLEFAAGSVLVAHNAPFDVGFLRAAAAEQQLPWPRFAVVDTAVLARRVLTKDEVPNCKLSSLAAFFHAATAPNHRALQDARATVDVLHGLIARLGNLGVQSLPELRSFCAQVPPAVRRKRYLADAMPSGPGVYVFRDDRGTPLYVGTSRNLRTRVRQYFVASEPRTRMGEMVALAERVDPIPCAHALEAAVRELRLIAAHKPRYNRRSKYPERSVWLKLTARPIPGCRSCACIATTARRSSARCARSGRPRRCATRSTTRCRCASAATGCRSRRAVRRACALAGIGRCAAPCEGGATPEDYRAMVELVAAAWTGDVRPLIDPMREKLASLSAQQRFEQAAVVRDRIATVVRACARMQRVRSLTAIAGTRRGTPGRRGRLGAVRRPPRTAGGGRRGRARQPARMP